MPGQSENCLNTSPGDQISKRRPLKRQVAIFLDPDLLAFADAQARLSHVSRGHYIRSLIRRELNQIPLFLEPELILFIDQQARLNHQSRSDFLRRLVRREHERVQRKAKP